MLYSIGYGNKSKADFIAKLHEFKIDELVDVRSFPYSKWQEWTTKNAFREILAEEKIKYIHNFSLGYKIRKPEDVVRRELVKVIERAKDKNIVLMCSELDHNQCHRGEMFLEPLIKELGANYEHIIFPKAKPDKTKEERIQEQKDFWSV